MQKEVLINLVRELAELSRFGDMRSIVVECIILYNIAPLFVIGERSDPT
jgi:hypothetical protein